jgi:hypothetical protein
MYEVFRHWDTSTVGLVNGLLQDSGLRTILRNWDACNITEIPIPAIYPNICVLQKEDLKQAKEIISVFRKSSETTGETWLCPCVRRTSGFQFHGMLAMLCGKSRKI